MVKKILVFNHCDKVGGGTNGLFHIVDFLNKADKYNVSVASLVGDGTVIDLLKQKFDKNVIYQIKQRSISGQFFNGGSKHIWSPGSIKNTIYVNLAKKAVESVIAKAKPDIVLLNSSTTYWISKIAKKYNCKVVLWVRETLSQSLLSPRHYYFKHFVNKYVDALSFISNYDMELYSAYKPQKHLMYNVINMSEITASRGELCSALAIDPSYKYLLYVGGVSKLKGTLTVLQIFARILSGQPDLKVKLLWLGGANALKQKSVSDAKTILSKLRLLLHLDYAQKCRSFIIDNNLEQHIAFMKTDSDISKYYAVSQATVFTPGKPHQGRPIIEAVKSKIPILIVDNENLKEYVCPGVIMYHNGDLIDGADKLLKCLTMALPVENPSMSERFNFDDYGNKLEQIIDGIN